MSTIALLPTDEHEVKECITKLMKRKSLGIDKITAEIPKNISNYIAKPLSNIFNKQMERGIWPSASKDTIIDPIYKSGDHSCMLNYRPISSVNRLSKIFEMILKKKLLNCSNKYNLLSKIQFGFREGCSSQDAVSYLTRNVYNAINESKRS